MWNAVCRWNFAAISTSIYWKTNCKFGKESILIKWITVCQESDHFEKSTSNFCSLSLSDEQYASALKIMLFQALQSKSSLCGSSNWLRTFCIDEHHKQNVYGASQIFEGWRKTFYDWLPQQTLCWCIRLLHSALLCRFGFYLNHDIFWKVRRDLWIVNFPLIIFTIAKATSHD